VSFSNRSKLVKEFTGKQRGRIWLERLPAYAPELNPVEYIWSYWKKHELPNFCPKDYQQLSQLASRSVVLLLVPQTGSALHSAVLLPVPRSGPQRQ
jgi:transposase